MFANFSESFSSKPLYFARTLIIFDSREHIFFPPPGQPIAPHFDRAVNCQPSYRAGPLIAEARAPQPSFYSSLPYFSAPGTPIFTKNPCENAKNLNFLIFHIF